MDAQQDVHEHQRVAQVAEPEPPVAGRQTRDEEQGQRVLREVVRAVRCADEDPRPERDEHGQGDVKLWVLTESGASDGRGGCEGYQLKLKGDQSTGSSFGTLGFGTIRQPTVNW